MEKKQKRFILVKQKGSLAATPMILIDRETRVQYLYFVSGYAGGLTVLVNQDGKPLLADTEDMLEN